jgi:curved DNA-binding protein CbpA
VTFYEELGVPADASLETIRDAYRNVARLLHPDVQTDPVLKESAEAQMKRINHLYGILSDPRRRRLYDQELASPAERPAPIFIQAAPPPDRFDRGNYGTLVWLAATAVCATFVIWLATRESSSSPAVYPLPASGGQASGAQAPAASTSRPSTSRPGTRAAATVPPPAAIPEKAKAVEQRDDELAALRGQLLAANTDRARLEKQMAARDAVRRAPNPVNLTPEPLAAPQPAPEIPLPAVLPPVAAAPAPARTEPPPVIAPGARWAGSWAYHQARTEMQSKALFPPEFIEAVITEDKGRIRGQYHARFKVADANISPDVDFRFEGKIAGPAGSLSWTGTGGAKGEVQLRLISGTTLEIVWSATQLGKSMGLASGTAVLDRKN